MHIGRGGVWTSTVALVTRGISTLGYERRYLIAAAIPSTRKTMTRSQISPMPIIIPPDIMSIMNWLRMIPVEAAAPNKPRVTRARFA